MKHNYKIFLACSISITIGIYIGAAYAPSQDGHGLTILSGPGLANEKRDVQSRDTDNPDTANPAIQPPAATATEPHMFPAQASVREQMLEQQLVQLKNQYHQQKSLNFTQWLGRATEKDKNFSLRETMQNRFNSESIDQAWAEPQEQQYTSLFSQDQQLADYALTSTQCRTTQCELSFHITNLDQANQLVEALAKSLQAKGQYPLIIATPDQQQGITRLYIANDENSFEFD